MPSFFEPRITNPLVQMDQQRITRPLSDSENLLSESPTAALPQVRKPLTTPLPPTRPLVIIPATRKRPKTDALPNPPHRSSPLALAGLVFGSIAIMLIIGVFVIPLDNSNGQNSQTLAQTVNNWITSSNSGSINPAQQLDPPTPTPALLTNEGYCGGTDIWGTCATAVTASGVMGTGQMQHPIVGATITQPFAHPEYQQWCGCWKPHTGIDLAAPYGTPVMATDSGQVIWTGWDWSGLGWAVKINHGHYIATIYGHLARFIVSVGQNVTKGQTIAYEGSTGASTGPHVHFMVLVNNIWVNPISYVSLP
jgi:Peptidase family M23